MNEVITKRLIIFTVSPRKMTGFPEIMNTINKMLTKHYYLLTTSQQVLNTHLLRLKQLKREAISD